MDSKAAQKLLVFVAEDHGKMRLAAPQILKLLLCPLGKRVVNGGDCQRQQNLVGVQAGDAIDSYFENESR